MKLKYLLFTLLLPAALHAQGIRYDSNVFTAAGNVPAGAQAPMYTLPYAIVTVCTGPAVGNPCTNTVPIFQDSALTVAQANPISADTLGRFGFWIAPGMYVYNVQTAKHVSVGTYPVSFIAPPGPQGLPGSGNAAVGTAGSTQIALPSGSVGASDATTRINSLGVQEYRASVSPNLQVFQRALANCKNQVVNVVWVTDSTGVAYQGDGSGEGPNNPDNRFAEQERLYLQGRCGSHGTGIVPYIKYLINGVSLPNGQYYGPSTGSLSQDNALGPWHNFGAGGGNQGDITSATAGSTINWTSNLVSLKEDSANIYCLTGPGYGTWSITVQPHEPVGSPIVLETGSCGGNSTTPAMSVVNVSGWTAQIVNVSIACSATPCKMWGIEGINGTTGVSVHNVGEASGFAEDYTVPNGFATVNAIANQSMLHIDFGTNESLTGVSASIFQTAMASIVANEKSLTPAPSVHIFQYPVCGVSGCPSMVNMSAAALAVSQTNPVGFVSMPDAWSNQFVASAFDGDQIHPSDAGALAEWERIKASEIDSESLVGGVAVLNGGNNLTGVQNIQSNGDTGYFQITGNISGKTWSNEIFDTTTGTNAGDYLIFDRSAVPSVIPVHINDVGIILPQDSVLGFAPGSKANDNPGLIDAAISRGGAPGNIYIGNGAPGDFSGSLAAKVIIASDIETTNTAAPTGSCGPNGSIAISTDSRITSCILGGWTSQFGASGFVTPVSTAPSGSCPVNGTWVFSGDGHATFCGSGTWTTKI